MGEIGAALSLEMVMNDNLQQRVQREKNAYDLDNVYDESAKLQSRFSHVFSCRNTLEAEQYYRNHLVEGARGGVVLDYGCYTGALCPLLVACEPERVVGIDISEKGIAEARQKYGHCAEFHTMDAHAMSFPDETFDLVVGRSILHHLDWEVSLNEIHRVLKPNGKALFMEPLGDNPGAKLIRRMTPNSRTVDEKPLSKRQIEFANEIFGKESHLFYNLVSVPAGMMSSLLFQSSNNILMGVAGGLDRKLSRLSIRYWMRAVVLCWEKID